MGPHSGPFWDRFWNDFWDPKCTQHRSNFDLKTDREANAEIFKNISRGYVFEDARNRKPVKNQHKFVFKIVFKCEYQVNTQKCSKKLPKWIQPGAMLRLRNRFEGVQERKKKSETKPEESI